MNPPPRRVARRTFHRIADHRVRQQPGTGEIDDPRVQRKLHDLRSRRFVGLECTTLDGEEHAAALAVAAADRR